MDQFVVICDPKMYLVHRNIARCNGRDFPEQHFSAKSEFKSEEGVNSKRESNSNSKAGIGDLLRNRVIAGRTLNMFFQWASTR